MPEWPKRKIFKSKTPLWVTFHVVCYQTVTIFEQSRDIIRIHTIIVTSSENIPAPGGHVFQQTEFIFQNGPYTITINVHTKFHEDLNKHMASRQYNKYCLSGHVYQQTATLFYLNSAIIRTNALTKFHEYWTLNTTSRVLTRFHYSHI
ncbi:hypothetical protein DPMN_068533 [Dreissena polymorpha]|uniref:Uncharacterized protein n=1 Tax=Dreissena polymorpha TaxID=45954 RepID=A0A9D3YXB1_DREPO|nr:hypothetical protein DPMN_068533 [Dreissena polymorpha]